MTNRTLNHEITAGRKRIRDAELALARVKQGVMQEIGAELRKAREREGWSVRETARRMKVSAAFLSDVESGKRFIGRETARKAELVLGRAWQTLSPNARALGIANGANDSTSTEAESP